MKIYYKGARTMFAECLDKLCLGKLMILTIKIAPECATFDTNVKELSQASIVLCELLRREEC